MIHARIQISRWKWGDDGGKERKQEAGTARGFRRQGSGFRYYLAEKLSNVGQFLNPEP
jgi:hypothetical protein